MSVWQKISDKVAELGGSVLTLLSGDGSEGPADPNASVSFTIAVIALGAKMAKADGIVSPEEVDAFKEVFCVEPDQLSNVARVFNLAKKDVAGFEVYAKQVAEMFSAQPEVLEDVIDSLFHIAKADGVIQESEMAFLRAVADIFGLTEKFRCIKARHIQSGDDDPYVILGIDPCVSDDELKRLYREIVKENHPDRHIAAGMPKEMIAVANNRLAAMNSAYEAIEQERRL
jgi:DnaJ like chaperone protein